MARPGASARLRGREVEDVAFSKPTEGERDAEEDVRTSCRSWGLEEEEY